MTTTTVSSVRQPTELAEITVGPTVTLDDLINNTPEVNLFEQEDQHQVSVIDDRQGTGLTEWCVDSGSGRNIGRFRSSFRSIGETPGHRMVFPNGESMTSTETGVVVINVYNTLDVDNIDVIPLTIDNCSLQEGFELNIISEFYLLNTLQYIVSTSQDGKFKYYSKDSHRITARAINGVYYIQGMTPNDDTASYRVNATQSINKMSLIKRLRLRHIQLAHCSKTRLVDLTSVGAFPEIPKLSKSELNQLLDNMFICNVCIKHKTPRMSYKKLTGSRPTERCLTLHTDSKGPFKVKGCYNGRHGMKHLLVVIDDYSSYKWVFFMREIKEIPDILIKLLKNLQTQYNDTPVKTLRSDGHRSFRFGQLKKFCCEVGIKQEFSHPHCQEENGGPECYNRTLMETTRTLLETAAIPDYLWPEAADYANDLLNRLHSRRIDMSPHEKFGLGKPDLQVRPLFGCIGFAHVPAKTRDDKSLSPRMHKSKFLGLSKEFKGFKVLDLTSRVVKNTRDFKVHSLHEEELASKAFNTDDDIPSPDALYGNWPALSADVMDDTNCDPMTSTDTGSVGVNDQINNLDSDVEGLPTEEQEGQNGELSDIDLAGMRHVESGARKDISGMQLVESGGRNPYGVLPECETVESGLSGNVTGMQTVESGGSNGTDLTSVHDVTTKTTHANPHRPKRSRRGATELTTRARSMENLKRPRSTILDDNARTGRHPRVKETEASCSSNAKGKPMQTTTEMTTILPKGIQNRVKAVYDSTISRLVAAKRSSRQKKRPAHLDEFHVNAAIDALDKVPDINIQHRTIPKTFREAADSNDGEKWMEAIHIEYKACMDSGTWRLMELPQGRKAIQSKWIFDIKENPDGTIEKYKARLVIQGFRQIFGLDYDETFAPVARYESLKMVLAIATMKDMEVHQMDVCTAFLNGILEDEIYMKQPEGFVEVGPEGRQLVCRLLKSLYGLKQAGRIWYQLLHDFLTRQNFTRCHKEYCIYIQRDGDTVTIIVVYVDDLTIVGSSVAQVQKLKDALSREFKMKDLGEIKYLLKIEINRNREKRHMTLSQRKYVADLVHRFDMTDAGTVMTPQTCALALEPETGMTPEQIRAQPYPYPELIGALLHLARGTRPDIANAVRVLSKFLTRYNETHWIAARRVLRYLKGTSDYGLVFDGTIENQITYQLYSDASFANSDEERKSVTGYCVMMVGGPISTKTIQQNNVTISTAEAELVACSEACRESEWIWFLLAELGFKQTKPIQIHCDNQSVVAIAKNPGNHNGTKHIEIRHLYVRHLIDSGRAHIKYCWTEDMIADILTKAVPTRLFLKLRHMLGVRPIEGSGSVGSSHTGPTYT